MGEEFSKMFFKIYDILKQPWRTQENTCEFMSLGDATVICLFWMDIFQTSSNRCIMYNLPSYPHVSVPF